MINHARVWRFAHAIRYLSTRAAETALPNAAAPPRYTLATVRAFPSLEPLTFAPVPASVLAAPLRRDILWRAVVYENDNKRVGSSNPPGRSENGYSRRKLLPQKGSGRARAGDANSPTRHNGARALARTAPNDYSTILPSKIYSQAITNALSHQYRSGNLFVIGGANTLSQTNELDLNELEIVPTSPDSPSGDIVFERFLEEYDLIKKKLLFIVSEPRETLMQHTERFKDTVDIVQQELVDVNDLLKAKKIFIELEALEYLTVTHSL
ncbi:hypothetical protein HG536_0A05860 [Torulaspora globosa]|uniref:Large ribosomal subunit protein uL4m n=1 Tax=Torulaspora globosa TaxID=48254 RepID=A0A7G3ZB85_9SACH|nr:uncharacterized protein HG536_0A05860 [Torulaspora globosa]QLL30771.1 hypothetical protein HG536_0A05860 [Torulaspora globosa]